MDNRNLRTLVRGTYDIQKLRIQMGNRIVGNFKVKLGQAPGESEDELDKEGKEILDQLRKSYKKITDGVKRTFPRQKDFKGDAVISTYTELCLMAEYVALEKQEDEHFRRMGHILEDYPIYSQFLCNIMGIGPAMAGVIVSEIDISKAKYPSSLWKYAGLDVVNEWHLDHIEPVRGNVTKEIMEQIPVSRPMGSPDLAVDGGRFVLSDDLKELRVKHELPAGSGNRCVAVYRMTNGLGRSRRKEHLIDVKYERSDGQEDTRKSITFNPFLKTKLIGVLGSSFLRVKDSPYADIYREYKHRLEGHAKWGTAMDGVHKTVDQRASKGHRHSMAIRYMVKRFLVDLWTNWRRIEGLPITPEYSRGKLALQHREGGV